MQEVACPQPEFTAPLKSTILGASYSPQPCRRNSRVSTLSNYYLNKPDMRMNGRRQSGNIDDRRRSGFGRKAGILHMVSHFMGYHVGIGKIAVGTYGMFHILEEIKVDIYGLVCRTVHGRSEQRVRWLTKGIQTGNPNYGDTFSPAYDRL